MSLNLAKKHHHHHHHHRHHHHHHHHGSGSASSAAAAAAATGPPPLPAEAKAVKLRPMTIDDLAPVHDLGERIYDPTLYPNLYRIWSESEVVELFGSDSEFCQVAGACARRSWPSCSAVDGCSRLLCCVWAVGSRPLPDPFVTPFFFLF
jgi:hypothetical protein